MCGVKCRDNCLPKQVPPLNSRQFQLKILLAMTFITGFCISSKQTNGIKNSSILPKINKWMYLLALLMTEYYGK